MKSLSDICTNIAYKELFVPGARVECMLECLGLEIGKIYTVGSESCDEKTYLPIKEGKEGWMADRFRKVD